MREPLPWIDYQKIREIPSLQSPFTVNEVVDLLELWCVSSIDKAISTSELANFFDDNLAITEDDETSDRDSLVTPSIVKKEEFFNFVHRRLKYRYKKWGDNWPFQIYSSRKNIEIRYIPNVKNINYLVFLFCSNLSIIKRQYRNLFTSTFEMLAFQHLIFLHPPESGWITKSMGANNKSIHTYTGASQLEKIEALAKDLQCNLNRNYRPTTAGDGGIDLVSFLSFDDSRASASLVFGQCACTQSKRELVSKISETSFDNIRGKIEIDSIPLNYLYTPQDLKSEVKPSNFDLDSTRNAIIIDRTRMLFKDCNYSKVIDATLRSYLYSFIYLRENYCEAL